MEHWYCIYTKQKKEDQICKRLMDIPEIEIFNPKLKRTKYMRGRLREVVEELFPSYIFSRFNPVKYYHMIKYTGGVKRIIGDGSGNPYIVDNRIIELIKSKAKNGFILIEPSSFNVGTGEKVIIKEGPLKGFMGIFLKELNARDRVLVLLNVMTYQARVEIEKGFLARV